MNIGSSITFRNVFFSCSTLFAALCFRFVVYQCYFGCKGKKPVRGGGTAGAGPTPYGRPKFNLEEERRIISSKKYFNTWLKEKYKKSAVFYSS